MTGPRIVCSVALLLVVVIFVAVLPGVPTGNAAASSNLSVAISGSVLTASRNNTLTIAISNVGKYMTDLDVALTLPPTLALFGDNHWIRTTFIRGDVIRANLTIFAPSSTAGTTLQGSMVAVYKLVGETVQSSETHMVSFLVRGWIDMKVYETTVSPDPALPGGQITISGNLLNRGVIAAMYTNVTAATDLPLVGTSIKPTYVGQVDPNAPAPFSVTALIDPSTPAGNYQARILVHYRDDLQIDQSVSKSIDFSVVTEIPKTQTARTSLQQQLLSNQMLPLGLAVVVALVVIGIFISRRGKRSEQ